jgi:hypothetical protein
MSTQTPQNHSPKRSRGRPKGYEPFSNQSDSKCLSTLTAFRKFINEKAGGDATGLILAYLESRHAKTLWIIADSIAPSNYRVSTNY